MIIGIGTDILNIENIRYTVENPLDPFVQKTYTEAEIALILTREHPLYSFATRFAAKEAVFKALHLHPNTIRLNEIEILEDENGSPLVILHTQAKAHAKNLGIQTVLLSLSYDTTYAIAYATAIGSYK